jgi:ParB-like nuclease domain
MKVRDIITESELVPAAQILKYVKQIHPAGEFHNQADILAHKQWTLSQYPVNKLHIYDPESDDDYQDRYNRVLDTDPYHVDRLISNIAAIVQNKPIVIDDAGYILDGNHRALAAQKAGLVTVPVWKPAKKVSETSNADLSEVYEFLDELTPDDVGIEEIGPYRVHFEGFSDMCNAAADERCQLDPSNPSYLPYFEAIYDEVLNDFIQREGGTKPIISGLTGNEENPTFYAVFDKSGQQKISETLKKVKGKWALVSRHDPKKVLQYYHGSGHPSKEWVSKVERRVHSFSEAGLKTVPVWKPAK